MEDGVMEWPECTTELVTFCCGKAWNTGIVVGMLIATALCFIGITIYLWRIDN